MTGKPAEEKRWQIAIADSREKFQKLAKATGLNFDAEALYAYQACLRNKFLATVAMENPLSLRMAMVNVAAVGLTLNPALGFAFLVPREEAVCLDISYRGLIKIATETGSIRWGKAELVYSNDKFEYRGLAKAPTHVFDPFGKSRGEFVGAYCIAGIGTADEVLVEIMTAEEIILTRNCSKAWQKKKGPWVQWFGEMAKKTVIKRAAKTWPRLGERFGDALTILEDNGEGLVIDAEAKCEMQDQGAEEPTGDPSGASEETRAKVARLVKRASDAGAWSAAEQYAKEHFKGDDYAYAIASLEAAQKQPRAQSKEGQQPQSQDSVG